MVTNRKWGISSNVFCYLCAETECGVERCPRVEPLESLRHQLQQKINKMHKGQTPVVRLRPPTLVMNDVAILRVCPSSSVFSNWTRTFHETSGPFVFGMGDVELSAQL